MRGRISVRFFGEESHFSSLPTRGDVFCFPHSVEGVMKVLENWKRCGLEDAEGEARRAGGFVAIALGDGRVERLKGDREGS